MNLARKLKLIGIVFGILLCSLSISYLLEKMSFQQVYETVKIENQDIPQYIINVTFDDDSMMLTGSQRVVYKNNQKQSLNNLYFHIYPNAYNSKNHIPFEKHEMKNAYPNGFNPGWIQILNVKENDQEIHYKVMGETATILRVTPLKPIHSEETIELCIDFMLKLPNVLGRMGYGENTVNIANWYPILAIYDDKGWNLDHYYPIGDPFYSEVAYYDVTITIPKEFQIATTGDIIKSYQKENKITYQIKAKNVRDFAMILSKFFEMKSSKIDEVEVRSYTINGIKGEKALQYGIDSIEIFNVLFGKYPYNQLSVVACDFFIGGMEYPNLVMIGQHLYDMEEDFLLEYVIAHEIAHQWWYGLVGSNQIKEPWLDEALTEYSTLMYFEKKYGSHIKEQIYEKMVKNQYENYLDLKLEKEKGILRSLEEFETSFEYTSLVYSKGAMFIEELRKHMGEEAFFKALREYFKTHQFHNATTDDFYNIFQTNMDKDLKPLFEKWLNP